MTFQQWAAKWGIEPKSETYLLCEVLYNETQTTYRRAELETRQMCAEEIRGFKMPYSTAGRSVDMNGFLDVVAACVMTRGQSLVDFEEKKIEDSNPNTTSLVSTGD